MIQILKQLGIPSAKEITDINLIGITTRWERSYKGSHRTGVRENIFQIQEKALAQYGIKKLKNKIVVEN